MVGDEIIRTHVVEPRFSNAVAREKLIEIVKRDLIRRVRYAREELAYLFDFEAGNTTDQVIWSDYIEAIKSAAAVIKSEIQNLASYDDAVAFIKGGYQAYLPSIPVFS